MRCKYFTDRGEGCSGIYKHQNNCLQFPCKGKDVAKNCKRHGMTTSNVIPFNSWWLWRLLNEQWLWRKMKILLSNKIVFASYMFCVVFSSGCQPGGCDPLGYSELLWRVTGRCTKKVENHWSRGLGRKCCQDCGASLKLFCWNEAAFLNCKLPSTVLKLVADYNNPQFYDSITKLYDAFLFRYPRPCH